MFLVLHLTEKIFSRGKLIYTPNTPVFNRVIKQVNETFQDLKMVQNLAERWLNDISPAIKQFLNQLDPEMLQNMTENISTSFPGLNNVSSLFANASDKIEQ